MAGDIVPNVPRDRPEDPKRPLQQDIEEDCQTCRLVGCGAFFGLAAYSYFSGTAQLEKQRHVILQSRSMFGMRSRRFGITGISLGLVGMGLWRAFN
ncbi:hypothetical protein E4U09_002899 [Claviceps aff. purpurea]|uniref:DUF4536 domain-containing protein n=1 Tax=Claviceps aff. purpurea TaxID=1967640 RepID=A0A9P7QH22_9HYPO|nr:hypothetical protein E4U09_002899 [Claviceps aff. purpurea]